MSVKTTVDRLGQGRLSKTVGGAVMIPPFI